MFKRLARHPLVLLAVFAVYFGLGKLGLAVPSINESVSAVWPPGGFALAAFILLGPEIWPAVLLAAFFVSFTTTGDLVISVATCAGNTIESALGAALVARFARGDQVFERAQTVFRFTAIMAVSTAISATIGALVVTLTGSAAWSDWATLWLTWWLGNFTGSLVVAPLVLLWVTTPIRRVKPLHAVEGVGLLVMVVCVGLVVFAGLFPSDIKNYPLEFLCVPFFLWAAFRFGRRQVTLVVAVLSGLAVWGALRGFGPFVRDTANESLVLLQAYMSLMAVMGIVLAAVVDQHKQAEARLTDLATTDPLTGLVNYRRLLEVLRAEIARSNRTRRHFAVLFVDMNGLKKINDRYGHLAGSRALCRVATTLRESCRTIDTPARFGGDEFAVVLPETGEEGARVVLRRVDEKLAAESTRPAVSVTGGVAVFPKHGDTPTLLLRAADQALYEAKAREGRAKKSDAPGPNEPQAARLF